MFGSCALKTFQRLLMLPRITFRALGQGETLSEDLWCPPQSFTLHSSQAQRWHRLPEFSVVTAPCLCALPAPPCPSFLARGCLFIFLFILHCCHFFYGADSDLPESFLPFSEFRLHEFPYCPLTVGRLLGLGFEIQLSRLLAV